MAALNRLGQRIKENFQESTRDISILSGGSGSSNPYFDNSTNPTQTDDKALISLLESRSERERLEGMKRIIAGMSKGRNNMDIFFPQVVKNVVASSIEIKKLVYIYLLRFASTNSDLVLLSINTFQKDLSDPSPLIRSMSLRVLTSIRVPVIQGIVMLGLKKLVTDRNPYVRKTVAGGLFKVYEMDTSSLPQLISLLQTLLSSSSPLTLGASLTAFNEMCPDRLDLLHPYFRHICRLLVDADEWGQVVALEVLTRYARTMLEKPNLPPTKPELAAAGQDQNVGAARAGGNDDDDGEDEFEGLDMDLAMFLHHAKPLFQSRNAAVVLATAKVYFELAPANHALVGHHLLVAPLLRLAGQEGSSEIASLTWNVIAAMAEERPWLFASQYTRLFVHITDPSTVKRVKLKALTTLVSAENTEVMMREFKQYTRLPEDVAEEAVRAIGHCVRSQPTVAEKGLKALLRLLKSRRDPLVSQAVIVLKSVILSQSVSEPQKLVARLAMQLDQITNPHARASVFWLVGQYAADEQNSGGVGWEGLAQWVPDILRKGIKGFINETPVAKLQILTLATKLLVLSTSPKLVNLGQYLFLLARYDTNYDVRDRARFLHALLRGVLIMGDKKTGGEDLNKGGEEKDEDVHYEEKGDEGEDEEPDLGGVILRREQVKLVLLGKREVVTELSPAAAEYDVGSLSRLIQRKLGNYTSLPEWTEDPTDSSLRDSDFDKPPPPPVITSISSSTAGMHMAGPVPVHVGGNAGGGGMAVPNSATSMDSSPIGSMPNPKMKFRDLDDFLNSEEEDEDEYDEEEEDDDDNESDDVVVPVSAQRSVPEYEYDDDDEDEEVEKDDNNDDDDEEEEEETDPEEETPLYKSTR